MELLPINAECPKCKRRWGEMVPRDVGPPLTADGHMRYIPLRCNKCLAAVSAPAFRGMVLPKELPLFTRQELENYWA